MNTIESMTDYRAIRNTSFFDGWGFDELPRKQRREYTDLCVESLTGQEALIGVRLGTLKETTLKQWDRWFNDQWKRSYKTLVNQAEKAGLIRGDN